MPSPHVPERSFVVALAANGLLGASIGALAAGVSGAQLGLAAGLVLAVLPRILRAVTAWLARPQGLALYLLREIARAAVLASAAILAAGEAILGPIRRALRVPTLALGFGVDVASRLSRDVVSGVGRVVFTPLGLANVAALAVIAAAIAGLGLPVSVAFVALVLLLLALLVNESESRDASAAPPKEGSHS